MGRPIKSKYFGNRNYHTTTNKLAASQVLVARQLRQWLSVTVVQTILKAQQQHLELQTLMVVSRQLLA